MGIQGSYFLGLIRITEDGFRLADYVKIRVKLCLNIILTLTTPIVVKKGKKRKREGRGGGGGVVKEKKS